MSGPGKVRLQRVPGRPEIEVGALVVFGQKWKGKDGFVFVVEHIRPAHGFDQGVAVGVQYAPGQGKTFKSANEYAHSHFLLAPKTDAIDIVVSRKDHARLIGALDGISNRVTRAVEAEIDACAARGLGRVVEAEYAKGTYAPSPPAGIVDWRVLFMGSAGR